MPALEPAILVLADGTVFRGRSIGARGLSVGEVVFNTAMTGYQEILTDPSYCRQIVTLTYPHIGNTGTNPEDDEADRVYASGLVVRDLPAAPSNWRATHSLPEYLRAKGVVALADIDTRRLTRILRERGAQNGCLMAGEADIDRALAAARAFPGLAGMDLAKEVSAAAPYEWRGGGWTLGAGFGRPAAEAVLDAASARDLVVMGTHGRTGLAHMLIGSVAEKVIRFSMCPVMVIRSDEEVSA